MLSVRQTLKLGSLFALLGLRVPLNTKSTCRQTVHELPSRVGFTDQILTSSEAWMMASCGSELAAQLAAQPRRSCSAVLAGFG